MEHFNTETRAITLVKEVKDNEELVTETYPYPFFPKGGLVKRAIDLGAEFEETENVVHSSLFDKLTTFVIELYQNKFTEEELLDGLSADKVIEVFISILMSVLSGESPQKNE